MKKIKLFVLMTVFILSACGIHPSEQTDVTAGNEAADVKEYDSFFTYEIPDVFGNFSVDNDGTVYLYNYSYNEIGAVDNVTIKAYDMDGKCTEICKTERLPITFDCDNGIIYGADSDGIFSLDTKTSEEKELYPLDGFSSVKRIEICGNNAYIFGIHIDRMTFSGEYSDPFGIYSYNGEKLVKINLLTGDFTDSDVEYPIDFSVYNGEAVVYAADEDGYYFADFENKNKTRHNIELLNDFDLFEPDRYVFTSGSGINIGMLCAGTVRGEDGTSQVVEDCYATDKIDCVGDYTYFEISGTLSESPKLCRIKNTDYIKKNNKINLIASDYCFDAPFGCGYTINYEKISAESFALSVLSQDSDYDMCIVNSFESFSGGIRDKGSFYPLNDVPEVNEYLGKCFPYVKEAATDENGDIWMLPVRLDVPMIVYNESVCVDSGFDFSRKMTVEEFTDICEKAYETRYKSGYSVHPYVFTQNLFIQYMTGRTSFDTPEFRSFTEFAKKKINLSSYSSYPPYMPAVGTAWGYIYEEGRDSCCLFQFLNDCTQADWFMTFDSMKFATIPSINENDKPTATCCFVTVNPATENLESTLDYVASLAEYLSEQSDSYMLIENNPLANLYSDAQIGFNASHEIYYDSYLEYQSGKITLDEFVAEADRKLSAYLNE